MWFKQKVRGVSDADLAILAVQDEQTLAQWYCMMNRWEWPKSLPDEEPREYIKNGRRSMIMWVIESVIGDKACLREHNKENLPGAEFELWYASDFVRRAKENIRFSPTRRGWL